MPLPRKETLFRHIAESPQPLTKRELVRAFDIKGDDRRILKDMIRDLEDSGQIAKGPGQKYSVPDSLPAVTVIEVTEIDIDGDAFAKPAEWNEEAQGPTPRIEIVPGKKGHPPLKEGDRALAALKKYTDKLYEARVIRALDGEKGQVMGVVAKVKGGFILQPTNRKAKYDFEIPQKDLKDAKPGDLAVGEIQPARGLKRKKVRLVEVIGRQDDPKAISLISLHEAGLRSNFPKTVESETKGLKVPTLKGRGGFAPHRTYHY